MLGDINAERWHKMDKELIKEKILADAQWNRYYEFLWEEGGKRK